MSNITTEDRSAILSVRAKLRKALSVHPDILNATETKQVNAAIERLTKLITPAKKEKAKKAPAKKAAAKKAPAKKAEVKKAA